MSAQETLVFGFGITNTPDEVGQIVKELKGPVDMLRNISPLYKKTGSL